MEDAMIMESAVVIQTFVVTNVTNVAQDMIIIQLATNVQMSITATLIAKVYDFIFFISLIHFKIIFHNNVMFFLQKIECTCKKYAKDNECNVDTGKCTCIENACGDECDEPCDEFCPNPDPNCVADPKDGEKCPKPILSELFFMRYLIYKKK